MEEQLSDAGLVRWALRAETEQERKAAFQAIAERYRLVVFRQCARWFPDPETAQDVCQTAFEAAFVLLSAGKGPARPDKLAGWLIEIARHRGQQQRRTNTPPGVRWAVLPEGQSLDELEDDEEPRSGSAVRRAQATRLVEAVVATLTVRQQQVYQLRYVQEMTGKQVAKCLGVADKTASNEITTVQALIADGFGALILYQEGRAYCPDLARIIDLAQAAAVGTDAFTTTLRTRITNHFDNCKVCDDCRTCNAKRRHLVGPYAPVLIPILFDPQIRDLITETIDRISTQSPSQPNHPQAGPPTGPPQATTGITETSDTVALANMATALSAKQSSAGFTDATLAPQPTRLARQLRQGRPPRPVAITAAVLILAGGIVALALPRYQQVVASIPITLTSAQPPDTGYVYVEYHNGQNANAQISGDINQPTNGEIARLYAQPFPFTTPPAPIDSTTLNPTGTTAPYTFHVAPDIATQYTVELFPNDTATTPTAISPTETVYVVLNGTSQASVNCGNDGACSETSTTTIFAPAAALSTEMQKQLYLYAAHSVDPNSTPGRPPTVQLGGDNVQVTTPPQQISDTEYTFTLQSSYQIDSGEHSSTLIFWCSKDTEAQDGMGLPGDHSCGDTTISATGYFG